MQSEDRSRAENPHVSPDPSEGPLDRVEAAASDLLDAAKPRLRGWLHLGTAPLALAAGIVLVCLAPTAAARFASAVYALSAVLLFSTSATSPVSPRTGLNSGVTTCAFMQELLTPR